MIKFRWKLRLSQDGIGLMSSAMPGFLIPVDNRPCFKPCGAKGVELRGMCESAAGWFFDHRSIILVLALLLCIFITFGLQNFWDFIIYKADLIDKDGKPGVLRTKNGKPLKFGPTSPTPPDFENEDDETRKRRHKEMLNILVISIFLAAVVTMVNDIFK